MKSGLYPTRPNPRTLSPTVPEHLFLAQLSYNVCMARSNPLHILTKHNLMCFFSRQSHALSASPFLLCPMLQEPPPQSRPRCIVQSWIYLTLLTVCQRQSEIFTTTNHKTQQWLCHLATEWKHCAPSNYEMMAAWPAHTRNWRFRVTKIGIGSVVAGIPLPSF